MPMLQFQCCGEVEEEFLHPSEAKTARPFCPECGKLMARVYQGAPAVVWARPMSYYNDKKLEGADKDYHVAYKVRSTTRKDGKPEPVIIDSRQAQLKYCREEGLVDPADAGKQVGNSDGLRHGVKPAGTARVN